jgi:acyl dehydratase
MLDGLKTPLELEGAELGPVHVAVTADRIGFYADVTGDEPGRWTAEAPPGFASVLLFAVADLFLYHPAIIPFTATLLHLDQSFAYLGPMRADSEIVMAGVITRVRERGGSFFVTFESEGTDGGEVVVRSVSTFVLSDQEAPAPDAPRVEPRARERGEVSGLSRSASRHDLVRYSAATRDFNPLHWDHDVAVAAGLPGTVVHGLLMYAWMTQAASQSAGGRRIAQAKVRFRTALFPGEQAELRTELEGSTVKIELVRGDEQLVTGTATVDPSDR